ncbi:hypothetical protein D3C86_1082630 [compost metagenome]
MRAQRHVALADRQLGAYPPGQGGVQPAGQRLREIVAADAVRQRRHPVGILDLPQVLLLQRGDQRLQRRVRGDVVRAQRGIGIAVVAGGVEGGIGVERAVGIAVDDVADPG